MWRLSSYSHSSYSLTHGLRAMLSPSLPPLSSFASFLFTTSATVLRSPFSCPPNSLSPCLLFIRCQNGASSSKTLTPVHQYGFFQTTHPVFPPLSRHVISSVSSGSEVEFERKEHDSSLDDTVCDYGDDDYRKVLLEVRQEKQSWFIPVNAFFLCTSVDLKSLQANNAANSVPPSSRAANYVVLRYPAANMSPNDPLSFVPVIESSQGCIPL